MKNHYSCKEIAERYGVKVMTVWNWVRTGRLSALRVGRDYQIRPADIEAMEARHTVDNSKREEAS